MKNHEVLELQLARIDKISKKISALADSDDNQHMFKTARKKPDFKNHPDYIKIKTRYLQSLDIFVEKYKKLMESLNQSGILIWDILEVAPSNLYYGEVVCVLTDGMDERDRLAPNLENQFDGIFMSSLFFDIGAAFCNENEWGAEDNTRKVNTTYLYCWDNVKKSKQEEVEATFLKQAKASGFKIGYDSRAPWQWSNGTVDSEIAIYI